MRCASGSILAQLSVWDPVAVNSSLTDLQKAELIQYTM